MINRQKIFYNITLAAKAGAQSNPLPSTSGTGATTPINTDQSKESTQVKVNCDNFSDVIDLDDNTITEIERSFALEEPKSPLPLFTTGNNKEITITTNPETTKTVHFFKKPPILVFSREKENEPPLKKFKVEAISPASKNQESASTSTNIIINKKKSESTSTHSVTNNLASKTTSSNITTNDLVFFSMLIICGDQ